MAEIDWNDTRAFFPVSEVPIQHGRQSRKNASGSYGGTPKIYALVDPRFRDVRYVGKTTKKLRQRLSEHLENPTNRRTREWFAELSRAKLRPEIVRLQRVMGGDWQIAEMQWIAWFRLRGDLLNVDEGGMLFEDGSGWDEVKHRARATITVDPVVRKRGHA
jgi:hypothetical protein